MGKVRAPYYRIVVADSRTKRDGRVIEEIGKYHPKEDPSFIEVNSERAQYWLGVGAQPSEPVTAILKVTGDWQLFKGEAAPAPMRVAEPRRDKTEIFNEALKDSHGELATEAVTARRPAKKAAAEPAPAQAAGDTPAQAAGTEGSESATGTAEAVAADVATESAQTEITESADTDAVEVPTDSLGVAGGEGSADAAATGSPEGAVAPGADAAPASGATDMAAGVAETKAAASDDESSGT